MTITETRGVWLTTTDSQVLLSQENIAQAMNFLAETGFNVVFPVVWTKGATLYPSQVMQQTFGIEIDPQYTRRDPIAEVVEAARRVGLKVIPWFEYGFASSYNSNGGILLAKKPEWAALDSQGNLLKKNGFEWLNALDREVQDFMLNLVLEVVKNYDVDGIQGDDRLPALPSEGGYDQNTIELYRQQFEQNPPQNPKDTQWLQWRADILTEFWARLYHEVKAVNSHLLVSIAPNIHDWAFKEYLQDSPTWLERKVVDMIHPQIYRRNFSDYKNIVDRLVNEQFTDVTLPKLAPGILMKVGSYRISPDYLVQIIEYNRACGINGEVFFFYEGLREDNYTLAQVLRTGPYAQSAVFPSLSALNQPSTAARKSKVKSQKSKVFPQERR
ncbi:family 10 glycosylhydrolase [Iningainema tapete]|uniref:Family 10 glycosylhydrolase n=1 Tax=Iningainema tapete BLCC-T55 TaxID=2748662 RepID=A0A8J7C5M6_9CYAN|nr:family 10 glycosylhydrolase [Iningainema tapete BLCC-T55]